MDVASWLRSLGLEQYEATFRDNAIDDSVLPDLTDQDLEKLGVLLGHRRKLLRSIANIEATAQTALNAPGATVPVDVPPRDNAERRQVTVMFSDLVGSTTLSARMDPEDLREVISAYQKCVAETVQRFGGFVAKFMGDGVLVYFGYPQAHEDDAEAICEAVTRTIIRFVPVKTPEQQSGLMLHRTRHLFIRQQTSVINAIRAHLAEFGVTAAVGRKGIEELLRVIADPRRQTGARCFARCVAALGSQLLSLKKQILDFDRMIMAWHRSNQTSKRLNCIPGVGPLLATALLRASPILNLPIGSQLLGLDRAGSQTALERRSG